MREQLTTLIAVPTRDRPLELRRCMKSIAESAPTADVLIIDNNVDGSAKFILDEFPNVKHYVPVQVPGLAGIRNRALEYFLQGDWPYLAFVDDDETIDAGWHTHGLNLLLDPHIDIVTGPARPVVASEHSWVFRAGFFELPHIEDGSRRNLAASNNVFIKRQVLEAHSIRFDPMFSSIGGEDTDFFRRLANCGARIVWSNHVAVDDWIPLERLTWRWVSRRAIRGGQISQLAGRRSSESALRTRSLMAGLLRIALGSGKTVVALLTFRSPRAAELSPLLRGIGQVQLSVGMIVKEYGQQYD